MTYQEEEAFFAERRKQIEDALLLPDAHQFDDEVSYMVSLFTVRFDWAYLEIEKRLSKEEQLNRSLHLGDRLWFQLLAAHDWDDDEYYRVLILEVIALMEFEEVVLIPAQRHEKLLEVISIVVVRLKRSGPMVNKMMKSLSFSDYLVSFRRGLSAFRLFGESSELVQVTSELKEDVGGGFVISKSSAAAALGVSEKTLMNRVSAAKNAGRELPYVKRVNGKSWVIVRELFEKWLLETKVEKGRGRPKKALRAPR